MQTFLPVAPKKVSRYNITQLYNCIEWDFSESVDSLDRQRLGKQRVEAMQLVTAITKGSGWSNHPAAKMWEGHVPVLISYGLQCCERWKEMGYKDTVTEKLLDMFDNFIMTEPKMRQSRQFLLPWWMGTDDFHQSHRSNLLRKMPSHYRQFWPEERDDLPYVWPF